MTNATSVEDKVVVEKVYVRKQKTLIVGPKTGITAYLALCAAIALRGLRVLGQFSWGFLGVQGVITLLRGRSMLFSSKPWKRLIVGFFGVEAIFYAYMQIKQARLQKDF